MLIVSYQLKQSVLKSVKVQESKKTMLKKLSLSSFFFLFTLSALAQTKIDGIVADAKTGEDFLRHT
jgi:hypothetical protein